MYIDISAIINNRHKHNHIATHLNLSCTPHTSLMSYTSYTYHVTHVTHILHEKWGKVMTRRKVMTWSKVMTRGKVIFGHTGFNIQMMSFDKSFVIPKYLL